jgi:hypothetical protein
MLRKILFLCYSCFLLGQRINAQISVTATTGTLGPSSYSTLKLAFDAVNAVTHQGDITILVTGNTSESAVASLNASGSGAASYSSILIQPDGGAERIISGNITGGSPLVNFNGADNVTIDGLNSGGNALILRNTSTSSTSGTSTIRFVNDASNNTITNCNIEGSGTVEAGGSNITTPSGTFLGGNIYFATATATGNDNNEISFCKIGPAGSNLPTVGIMSYGTNTSTLFNSGNVIQDCEIFDFFSPTKNSCGIFISQYSTEFTIQRNKIFQSVKRVQTTAKAHFGININNNGNAYQIKNNVIGFSSNSGSGIYEFEGVANSAVIPIAVYVNVDIASFVEYNTIKGIALSGAMNGTATFSSTTFLGSPFAGIFVLGGLVSVNYNTIGDMTSNGSISFESTSTSNYRVSAIFMTNGSSPTAWTINNNNIGGFTLNMTNPQFYGILVLSYSDVCTVQNNVIGGDVSFSIQCNGSGSSAFLQGILIQRASTVIENNIIKNLRISSGSGIADLSSIIGIVACARVTGKTHSINGNHIYNLENTESASAVSLIGLYYYGSSVSGNIVSRNKIYNITTSSTSSSSTVRGMYVGPATSFSSGVTNFYNNVISLGENVLHAYGGAATDADSSGISGICVRANDGTYNFYHNSVYIGGSASSGSGASYAFNQAGSITVNRIYRNNIFQNSRSSSGKNYSIKLRNNTSLTINNNIYFVNGTGGNIGFFSSSDRLTLTDWKTALSTQDGSSYGTNPQFIDPANSPPDLHIKTNVLSEADGNGSDVGIATDLDGDLRSTLTPTDIGADAFVSGPLPVTFLKLSGHIAGGQALINWKVAQEIDVQRYEIQKSTDGNQFETVGVVEARQLNSYDWLDNRLFYGYNFYRIRSVNIDGSFDYSRVLRLQNISTVKPNIYPNPVGDILSIQLQAINRESLQIHVYDVLRKRIKSYIKLIPPGIQTFEIDVASLRPGQYYLHIQGFTFDKTSILFLKL